MLKIVIAEDAAIEREGLVRSIDWTGLGLELTGAAEDGRQAWELVEKHRPDLLLTDIKMPLMDGIELAKLVRERYPSTKVLFFSGYEDFNFALEAIKSKVCEYILKPYTLGEITAAIRKAAEQALEERRKLKKDRDMVWDESRFYREEKTFKTLLYGLHQGEFALEELGLLDPKPAFALMLARIEPQTDDGGNDELAKQRSSLILRELLKKREAEMAGGKLFSNREGELLLLLNDERHALCDKETMGRIGLQLLEWIRSRMKAEAVIAASCPVGDLRQLADCYMQTLETLKLGEGVGKEPILFYEDMNGIEAFTRMDKIVKSAESIIRKRYMEPITLDEIAQEVYMSPNYLNAIFKKIKRVNMHKFLIEVRVAKAAELLQGTDAVISRVAESVGYKNIAHFSTVFKKHTGMSPMEYRDGSAIKRTKW
ncbi:response regulator transcription factor [Paenibacillus contaminans]|uniref:DNA-binding response regulator n=1 Tax=Paenibacillus contaminans TaxID=450362 RepID=A0A329MNZ0_9BACL|nr:response regulator [Paenibacillus contaminans]RAV21619.1 hypothetical protein DQG23_10195 [Paenibacillus contaminans]